MQAAIAKVMGPGAPFEICPADVKLDLGTTAAPHLQRAQQYTVFKRGNLLLPQLYEVGLKVAPDDTFLVYQGPDAKGGVERMTFKETYTTAAGLAGYLLNTLGVKHGERVAMAMRNYPEWCLSFMAATSIGAVAVPTNSLWTTSELEYGSKLCFASRLLPRN